MALTETCELNCVWISLLCPLVQIYQGQTAYLRAKLLTRPSTLVTIQVTSFNPQFLSVSGGMVVKLLNCIWIHNLKWLMAVVTTWIIQGNRSLCVQLYAGSNMLSLDSTNYDQGYVFGVNALASATMSSTDTSLISNLCILTQSSDAFFNSTKACRSIMVSTMNCSCQFYTNHANCLGIPAALFDLNMILFLTSYVYWLPTGN